MQPSATFEDRYMPEPNSGCFIWLGPKLVRGGYGNYICQGVQQRAHRASYEREYGAVPEGLHVLHRCDTPICVNPRHLFLGTIQDNMKDKRRKGRAPKGAQHWSYKTGKFVGRWARRTKVLERYKQE